MNFIRFHSGEVLDPRLQEKTSQSSFILDPAQKNRIKSTEIHSDCKSFKGFDEQSLIKGRFWGGCHIYIYICIHNICMCERASLVLGRDPAARTHGQGWTEIQQLAHRRRSWLWKAKGPSVVRGNFLEGLVCLTLGSSDRPFFRRRVSRYSRLLNPQGCNPTFVGYQP